MPLFFSLFHNSEYKRCVFFALAWLSRSVWAGLSLRLTLTDYASVMVRSVAAERYWSRPLGGIVRVTEKLERETGIEPATSSLGSWHSTAELLPLGLPLTCDV